MSSREDYGEPHVVNTHRYDAHVLDALCRVLDVGVGDLLVYVAEGE